MPSIEPTLLAAPRVQSLTVATLSTLPIIPQILPATLLTISERFMTISAKFMTTSTKFLTISAKIMITSMRIMITSNILLIVFVNLADYRRQVF